ncbi:hypothetical protein HDU98_010471, partial [Podochytrium sp. JEL0797]
MKETGDGRRMASSGSTSGSNFGRRVRSLSTSDLVVLEDGSDGSERGDGEVVAVSDESLLALPDSMLEMYSRGEGEHVVPGGVSGVSGGAVSASHPTPPIHAPPPVQSIQSTQPTQPTHPTPTPIASTPIISTPTRPIATPSLSLHTDHLPQPPPQRINSTTPTLAPNTPTPTPRTLHARPVLPDPPSLDPTVYPPKNHSSHLWDYLKGQLLANEYSNDNPDYMNVKKERIENFLTVPYEFEKLMALGYLICLDSFLYVFTILPARIVLALGAIFHSVFFRSRRLSTSQKCDLMKGLLVGICCYMLENVDGSRLYHSVRGQSTIKLYVIFNMLEICDKLCSAFGHDVLDSLFSNSTPTPTPTLSLRRINRVTHFSLALLYVFVHSMVLFYQVMALNVAINSYNNALLSLLLSNQFMEIKSSVFKKFERENLFQLSCSDIVERFQLSIFLIIISIRNLVELTGATATTASLLNPFTHLSTTTHLNTTLHHLHTFSTSFLHTLATETPVDFLHRLVVHTIPSALATARPREWAASILTWWNDPALVWISPHMWGILQTLVVPVLAVMGTEFLVDWLKHAFITKFNQLKVGVVYRKYRETLCRDLVVGAGAGAGEEGN